MLHKIAGYMPVQTWPRSPVVFMSKKVYSFWLALVDLSKLESELSKL